MPWAPAKWLLDYGDSKAEAEDYGEVEISTYDHKPRVVHGFVFVRYPAGDVRTQTAIPVRRIVGLTWEVDP